MLSSDIGIWNYLLSKEREVNLLHMKKSEDRPQESIKDISKMAISVAFAIIILCIVVLGGYSVYQTQKLNEHTEDIYSHPFIVSNALRDISILIISMRSNMQDIPFESKEGVDRLLASMQEKEAAALERFDVVLGAFLGDKKEIEQTRDMFIRWRAIRHSIALVAKDGARDKAHAQTHGFGLEHVTTLRTRIRSHIEYANIKANHFRESSSQLASQAVKALAFLSILIFLAAIVSFVFVLRSHKEHAREINRYIQTIKRSEGNLRAVLDTAPDAILVIDQKGIVCISNDSAQKVLGYTKDALLGQPFDILIPNDLRQQHRAHTAHYFEKPKVRSMNENQRFLALHKDGHTLPVMVNLSPLMLDGKNYVTCDIRDMTEFEALEEKFRQSQKMEAVGALVGGIAHDFNNILAAISGEAFLGKLKDENNKHFTSIEVQVQRAADIVKQLLAFARKDIRKLVPMSLSESVHLSANLFKLTIHEGVQLNVDVCQESLPIKGDMTQLQQVILNLVNNAHDSLLHQPTPVISVSVGTCELSDQLKEQYPKAAVNTYACLSVSDNGHGIDKKHIAEIFEPFFTKKEVGKGTGLGLSMVKGIIESHDGIIDVESIVGEGTTFRVFLPLLEAEVKVEAEIETRAGALDVSAGECILLVDDESVLREVNREILEALGYEVIEAADGLQAVTAFQAQQEHIRLVVMDVVMPRMGGIKAAEKIREISGSVPIVFATGYDRSQVLGGDDGALSHSSIMTKPFTANELSQAIRELI